MNLKSIGKLVYSPRTHLSNSEKWLIVMCDDEISKYYRYLCLKEYPCLNGVYYGKLTRPVWGAHISVIRGEKIPNFNLWESSKNKLMEFEYEPGVQTNGEYFWLKVYCTDLEEIRKLYGLNSYPKFGFHLTVGRIC